MSADHARLVSAVKAPGYQRQSMIVTSAGRLPSKNIIHVVVGNNDSARIKDVVYSTLKLCEDSKFNSVTFPALGTGVCQQRLSDQFLLESHEGNTFSITVCCTEIFCTECFSQTSFSSSPVFFTVCFVLFKFAGLLSFTSQSRFDFLGIIHKIRNSPV